MSNITEKTKWYWKRLRAMRAEEVYHRLVHVALKRTEKSARERILGAPAPEASVDILELPDGPSAPEAVLEGVRRDRDAILSGRWNLFGSRQVSVEVPPVWCRDYLAGADADSRDPSHKINHRELAEGADCRCIWEINRWTEIVHLAKAAYLLDDEDAAHAAVETLSDWVEKNPVGYGINWTSPMEAGIRLINFVWIESLLRRSVFRDLLGKEIDDLVQKVAPSHVWWVWRYRSHGSSANNHLLGELASLLVALGRWPSLESWAHPTDEIAEKFEIEVLRQFAPDGGNREQALHYHIFAWEMAWHGARAIGTPTAAVTRRLAVAAKFFAEMAEADEPWDFGDCDDAVITPLWSDRRHCLAEWRDWFAGGEEGGGSGLEYWWGAPPRVPYDPAEYHAGWTVFLQSGLAVRKTEGWKLRLDASPLGYLATAAHGHLDALHLSIWNGGRALIIDPGTGGYYGAPALREHLASWEAHNGLHLPNQPTPRRAGPFLWENHHGRPRFDLGDLSEIRAEFDSGEAILRRSVERRCEGDGWEISDTADGGRKFCVNWQIAPGTRLREIDPGSYLLGQGDASFLLVVEGAEHIEVEEAACSPRFRETLSSPVIRVLSTGTAAPLVTRLVKQG